MKNLLQRYLEWSSENKKKSNPKLQLAALFVVEFFAGFLIYLICVAFLAKNFHPNAELFMTMIKGFDVTVYLAIATGMLGYLKFQNEKNIPLALAALFCLSMAVSSQLLTLIPADIQVGDSFSRRSTIYWPISIMFISLLCITFNLSLLIFRSVENRPAEH